MKKLWILLLLTAFIHSAFGQAEAEENRLEEVLIQGNRLETLFSESTRDIQILRREEISKLPVHSVNELLAYVGGVDVRQRGPFGGQADISIDGGTFEQTLVLLDGVKLIDDQTAHLMMNIPIPLSAIDHVEVLRGAAARLYGVNALTGAINIVTRKENTSFVAADIRMGSSFKQREEKDRGGLYGGGGLELVGNYATKKQRHLWAMSQDLYNGQRYNTALNNTRLFYTGKYRFDTQNAIQTLIGYANNRYGANGFYAAPGDKDAEEINETFVFSLSSIHKFGRLTFKPRISNRYDRDDYRYFKHDLDQARSLHYTNALMAELNASLMTNIGEFGWGWESRFSRINSSNIGKHTRDNHGAYAEYKGKYGQKWIATMGAYLNYNTDYGWQVYPGADVAFLPNKKWKFSASIGSAQRLPSFTDLYVDQAPGNVGNPDLGSEKAWQYELGVDYTSNTLKAKAGYFYRDISAFIDWVREEEDQPYRPYNLGSNRFQGIYGRLQQDFEISSTQQFGYHIRYHYLNPKMQSVSGLQSKYVLENLKHQLILGASYTYGDFLFQFENRTLKRELNSGYTLLDVRFQYQRGPSQFYLDISNVFNSAYREAGAVPMPPRWFNLGVKYQWNKR